MLHHPLLLDISIEFPPKGVYCGEKWTITLDEYEIVDFYNQLVEEMGTCLKENVVNKNEKIHHNEITAKHFENKLGIYIPLETVTEMHNLINSD